MKAAERAYQALRAGIIDGSFPPASRLTEAEVAGFAGVSRTPVREAMRRLEAEGLVRVLPHQGTFVSSWDGGDVDDIFDLRALLEGYAAQRCAERATKEEIDALRALATEHGALVASGSARALERVAALNEAFHGLIQAGARSDRLRSTLAVTASSPLVYQTLRDYGPEDLARSARHHQELAEAIAARDGDWAAAAMRTHVLAAKRLFKRVHDDPH